MASNLERLIVIEGIDGSGKETQTKKLYNRLLEEGKEIMKIQFPRYDKESSALIKMYLNGAFGTTVDEVNPFVASTFFAVDRYASFKEDWEGFYKKGGIILSDRYTTSNMVHQASKIKDQLEREKYLEWLWNFEFELFQLPIPRMVIFLDMPPEYGGQLISERFNKISGEKEKDIHENNYQYLMESYNSACTLAEKYKWYRISCVEQDQVKTIEAIHEEIYQVVKELL